MIFETGGIQLLVETGPVVYWMWSDERPTFTISRMSLGTGEAWDLAIVGETPGGIAIYGDHIYWTEPLAGRIMRVGTGAPEVLPELSEGLGPVLDAPPAPDLTPETIAENQGMPSGVSVDATAAYWVNNADGTVLSANLGDFETRTVAFGQDSPSGIALDADEVFWTSSDVVDPSETVTGSRIGARRATKDGGPAEVVAVASASRFTGISLELAVDGEWLLWSQYVNSGVAGLFSAQLSAAPGVAYTVDSAYPDPEQKSGFATNGSKVVWLAEGLHAADLDGSNRVKIFDSSLPIGGIGLIGDTVYVANATAYDPFDAVPWAIKVVPIAGGTPDVIPLPGEHLSGSGYDGLRLLVEPGPAIYWVWSSNASTFNISRLDVGTGDVETIVEAEDSPGGLAVADGYLYWTEPQLGRVLRVPSP